MAGKNKFVLGFTVYMLILFSAILIGLALLWKRMDAYEQSRPEHALEALIARTQADYWSSLLLGEGVPESYVSTLDFTDISFFKKMEISGGGPPVYGIRFGDTEMLHVYLKGGRGLSFGYHQWEVDYIEKAESRLFLYVPLDAVIRVEKGEADSRLVQENVPGVEISPFDKNRKDAPRLAKYHLPGTYDMNGVTVTDKDGNLMELSYSQGNSYYFVPPVDDYTIIVPSGSKVRANGILLDAKNSSFETRSMKDFEGIEDFVPFVPKQDIYTIEGLLLPPDVTVETVAGSLSVFANEDKIYLYEQEDELSEDLSKYIMTVFDAYIAYSGNRSGELAQNYQRYLSYLLPGSEPAQRASKAQASIAWMSGRDARLKSAEVRDYVSYSEELFTCRIYFSLRDVESQEDNVYLFIFRKYNGEWRVARILNKSSFLQS